MWAWIVKSEPILFHHAALTVKGLDLTQIPQISLNFFDGVKSHRGFTAALAPLGSHRSHSNMKQRLMPLYDKIMLRKRSIIETVNDMLKNVVQLVHTRHRSRHNFLMNLLAAMGAYCFFLSKSAVNFDYEVPNSDGQLTIWQ